MPKYKADIYYPIQVRDLKIITLTIPDDNKDPEKWLQNHALEIIEKALPDLDHVGDLFDLGIVEINNLRKIKE